MKKQEIRYTFVNPNTPEDTLKILKKMIIEKIQMETNQSMLTAWFAA